MRKSLSNRAINNHNECMPVLCNVSTELIQAYSMLLLAKIYKKRKKRPYKFRKAEPPNPLRWVRQVMRNLLLPTLSWLRRARGRPRHPLVEPDLGLSSWPRPRPLALALLRWRSLFLNIFILTQLHQLTISGPDPEWDLRLQPRCLYTELLLQHWVGPIGRLTAGGG